MGHRIAIRENATGLVRFHPESEPVFNEFIWTEGNYSCDCNRHLLFQWAGGEEDGVEQPCGEDAYTALYVEFEDGSRTLIEAE